MTVSEESVWDILGIAETTNEREIKRAYAAKLKITSPESDAAGYMRLRAAFESAKQYVLYQRQVAQSQASPTQDEAAGEKMEPTESAQRAEDPRENLLRNTLMALHDLLAKNDLNAYLEQVRQIHAENRFATLDEQFYFVGEVACLIQHFQIADTEWCASVAMALDAREGENIFPTGTRYWFAYNALLVNLTASRESAMQAHANDDARVTPGYLHVFHVLTSPFDSERLSALTRSRTYHRLAQIILERAKTDSTISIPQATRDWWERTALTGQHQPLAEIQQPQAAPAPERKSRRFPAWTVLMFIVFLGRVVMMIGEDANRHVAPEQVKYFQQTTPESPAPLTVSSGALMSTPSDRALTETLVLCDKETRDAVLTQLALSKYNRSSGSSSGTADPLVASLLTRCNSSQYSTTHNSQPPPLTPSERERLFPDPSDSR